MHFWCPLSSTQKRFEPTPKPRFHPQRPTTTSGLLVGYFQVWRRSCCPRVALDSNLHRQGVPRIIINVNLHIAADVATWIQLTSIFGLSRTSVVPAFNRVSKLTLECGREYELPRKRMKYVGDVAVIII